MSKVVIGIPVLVNEHTEALELCLASIREKSEFEVEICILLHWDDSFSSNIDILPLLKRYSPLKIYLYHEKQNHRFKQELIDNIRRDYKDFDYMIIMHSDVFLWRKGAITDLLKPYENDNYIATFHSVPLHLYRSTFHINEQKKLLIAPRISSWFFSINIPILNSMLEQNQEIIKYPLFIGGIKFATDEPNEFVNWAKQNEKYMEYTNEINIILFDVGCFFLYYIQKLGIPYYSFGMDSNPDFKSMELFYREDGIVHLEQFDPRRFNDQFYSKDVFQERIKLVKEILKEYE